MTFLIDSSAALGMTMRVLGFARDKFRGNDEGNIEFAIGEPLASNRES